MHQFTKELIPRIIFTENGKYFLKDINIYALSYFLDKNFEGIDEQLELFTDTKNFYLIKEDMEYYIIKINKNELILTDLYKKEIIARIIKKDDTLINFYFKDNLSISVISNDTYFFRNKENKGGTLRKVNTKINEKYYFEYQSLTNKTPLFNIIGIPLENEFDYENIFNKLNQVINKNERKKVLSFHNFLK